MNDKDKDRIREILIEFASATLVVGTNIDSFDKWYSNVNRTSELEKELEEILGRN
jgi:hypothetical protein